MTSQPSVTALLGLLCLGWVTIVAEEAAPMPSVAPPRNRATVVLSYSGSPYRALAAEVAAIESVPIADSVAKALAMRPAFLLWVVSPTELSDRAATDFVLSLERSPRRPAVGLITGSTLDLARGLYDRARRARGDRSVVVLGRDTFSPAEIVESAGGQRRRRPPSGAPDVLDLLTRFDYVHYAGHGANASWRPLENVRIAAQDIPALPGIVVSTMSCQTARIWEKNSMALRMVDQGAAVYSGFFYSPLSGFQIGEDSGPFGYTWPEAPVGFVVEALNAGARKGYARFPFHLLVGDPRVALRTGPPCRLVDHGESGGVRTLSCQGAPAGLIPVWIPGGAGLRFVEVEGRTAVWSGEPFYNRWVQTAAIGEDRIVLVDHRGGDLHIAARHEPPVLWVAVDTLTDAMDDLLVSLADRRHGGDVVALVLAAIAVAATAWRVWRRRFGRVHLVPAAVVGVLAGVLHASYAFARGSDLSVIGKTIVFSPLAAVGTGILVGCGAWCFLAARSWKGRLLGTIVATSVGWVGGLVALAIRGLTSVLIASSTGIGVWIYTIDLHHFIMSGLGCLVFALVFAAARRIGQPALTPPRRP